MDEGYLEEVTGDRGFKVRASYERKEDTSFLLILVEISYISGIYLCRTTPGCVIAGGVSMHIPPEAAKGYYFSKLLI